MSNTVRPRDYVSALLKTENSKNISISDWNTLIEQFLHDHDFTASKYIPLQHLTGEYTVGSVNSNNTHEGAYGLVIGANNSANSQATIFGSDNVVANETPASLNTVFGNRHRSYNNGYAFIFGVDSDVDTSYNCFIHTNSGKICNQRDSLFAGWALDVYNEDAQGFGNLVVGHYRDSAQTQYNLRDINLSAFMGGYHTAERSYADAVFGSLNQLCDTKTCLVSGYKNYLSGTKQDAVGGISNHITGTLSETNNGTTQSTSIGNAVFGTSNTLSDSTNNLVSGYLNTLSGGCDTLISGSKNTVTNPIGVFAHGTLMNVRNSNYTIVLGHGLSVDTGITKQDTWDSLITGARSTVYGAVGSVVSISDASKSDEDPRGIDTVAYSAIFGKWLDVERMAGSLVVGDGHIIHPSKYVTSTGGLKLNSSYNLIGGQQHEIYSAWRSVIAGGADEDGNTNYIEDIWNSTIVGTNIRAYRVAETAIFGEAHRVGSYDDTDHTNTNNSALAVDSVLISGRGNKIKRTHGDLVSGESNTLFNSGDNIVSGAANNLNACFKNAVSGHGNTLSSTVKGSQVSGYFNTVSNATCCVVGGEQNTLTNGCTYSNCFGSSNTLASNGYCTVIGNACSVKSGTRYNFLHGQFLEVTSGYGSSLFGQYCIANAQRTFTAGYNLNNNCEYEVMFGRFSSNHTNANGTRYLFCIGDGVSKSSCKDAVLIYAQKATNNVDEYVIKLGTTVLSETQLKKLLALI